jgi:hypothetical protein
MAQTDKVNFAFSLLQRFYKIADLDCFFSLIFNSVDQIMHVTAGK